VSNFRVGVCVGEYARERFVGNIGMVGIVHGIERRLGDVRLIGKAFGWICFNVSRRFQGRKKKFAS
jgi:hypothetical protein